MTPYLKPYTSSKNDILKLWDPPPLRYIFPGVLTLGLHMIKP